MSSSGACRVAERPPLPRPGAADPSLDGTLGPRLSTQHARRTRRSSPPDSNFLAARSAGLAADAFLLQSPRDRCSAASLTAAFSALEWSPRGTHGPSEASLRVLGERLTALLVCPTAARCSRSGAEYRSDVGWANGRMSATLVREHPASLRLSRTRAERYATSTRYASGASAVIALLSRHAVPAGATAAVSPTSSRVPMQSFRRHSRRSAGDDRRSELLTLQPPSLFAVTVMAGCWSPLRSTGLDVAVPASTQNSCVRRSTFIATS